MGAKTSFLAIYAGDPRDVLRAPPPLDHEAARRFAEVLTGGTLESAEDGTLGEGTNPPDGVVFAASYPGLDLLCDGSLALDRPSQLPARYTRGAGRVVLHAMHSVVDWFAFGVWDGGALVRALSVSPDHGVIEDIGPKLPFEAPYWAGKHPVGDEEEQDAAGEDAYLLPFHAL